MIKSLLLAAFIGSTALAQTWTSNTLKFGNQTTSGDKKMIFNRGSANPQIRWSESNGALQFTNDGVNFSDLGSGSGSGSGLNLITKNPDFEQSITTGWTNSGATYAAATSGGNLLFGKQSATWTPTTTGQTLVSDAYTVPNGLAGGNCSVGLWYKGGSSTIKLQAVDGSNVVLAERVLDAATSAVPYYATFVCPSSGTIKLRLISTGSSALVAIDRTFLGENSLIAVGQAKLIGAAHIGPTSSCSWGVTSSTFASFTTEPACPGPTVDYNPGPGTIQTTDTDLPKFTVANLPPGDYEVIMVAPTNGGSANGSLEIFDGTTESGQTGFDSTSTKPATLVGHFTYSTAGDRTFEVRGANSSSTTALNALPDGAGWRLNFFIKRFPATQEQAYKPDSVANSWSGYHDGADCSWSTTSTSFVDPAIDATCTLTERTNINFGTVSSYNDGTPGNNYPGIVFTPSRAGTYKVCANVSLQNSTSGSNADVQLTDGSVVIGKSGMTAPTTGTYVEMVPVCGMYKATSTSAVTLKLQLKATGGGTAGITPYNSSGADSVAWSIFQIDQALPAPLLVNSVVSPLYGVTNVVYAKVSGGGTNNACSSGSCTISNDSGGVSVSHTGTGTYSVSFSASTFGTSPVCVATDNDLDAGGAWSVYQIKVNSSTQADLSCVASNNFTTSDCSFNLQCMGRK